ncbi:MAG TPA: hypothetical protein VIA29_08005 [Thermoanaerobaculia bacterium]|jgi:hypothetical protein
MRNTRFRLGPPLKSLEPAPEGYALEVPALQMPSEDGERTARIVRLRIEMTADRASSWNLEAKQAVDTMMRLGVAHLARLEGERELFDEERLVISSATYPDEKPPN